MIRFLDIGQNESMGDAWSRDRSDGNAQGDLRQGKLGFSRLWSHHRLRKIWFQVEGWSRISGKRLQSQRN